MSIRCPPSEDLKSVCRRRPGAAEGGEGTSGSSKAAEGSPWDSPPSSWQEGQERLRHTAIWALRGFGVWGVVGGVSQPFLHGNHRTTGLLQTRLSLWEPSRWERMNVRGKAQGDPQGRCCGCSGQQVPGTG